MEETNLYGRKAAVLKLLAEDKEFQDLIPKTIYISDAVFYRFLLEERSVYEKIESWFDVSLKNTGEEADEIFEELKEIVRETYTPFLQKTYPDLPERIEREIGVGKRVIVRSSGLEDAEDIINAGGNCSVPEVEAKEIYAAITEVVISYFSPEVLYVLRSVSNLRFEDPYHFKCPVFIQEMVGSTNIEIDTEMYPVIGTEILLEVAEKVLALKKKFEEDVDTEWVFVTPQATVSAVAFSQEPYYGADCVCLLCSLGVGSAVRRSAIVNAANYLIPYRNYEIDRTLLIEYPDKKTQPYTLESCEYKLVQCRPSNKISSDILVNKTLKEKKWESESDIEYYPFQSIVIGKGDVGGRFIIRESISEAWEEYIHDGGKTKYVGCIVRHGAALEHAGIMFSEKGMPALSVEDDVFSELAVKYAADFVLCLERGIFFENKEARRFEYEKVPRKHLLPLHIGNAKVRLESEQYCDEIKDEKVNFLDLKEGALRKGIQIYHKIFDILTKNLDSPQNKLFWDYLRSMFVHGELLYDYKGNEIGIESAVLEKVQSLPEKTKSVAIKRLLSSDLLRREYREQLLFSLDFDELSGLPQELCAEYHRYHTFLKKYGLFNAAYTEINSVYHEYSLNICTPDSEKILDILIGKLHDFKTAEKYLHMLQTDTLMDRQRQQELMNSLILEESTVDVKKRISAIYVILLLGGMGDIELFCGKMERYKEFISFLGTLHSGEYCGQLEEIFKKYQNGLLDQKLSELSLLRGLLIEDSKRLLEFHLGQDSKLYPVWSNIVTNLTNIVIDLFDMEGKSYANSLAMEIHSLYPVYVRHLLNWNIYLKEHLIDAGEEYSEVAKIMGQKIKKLQEKRNNSISICVDYQWYEKMTMDLDFNPHEIQNILHQASIYFANRKNRFYSSAFVEALHKNLITFRLNDRRLLKNQSNCIEIETGLGSCKLHKSSVIVGNNHINAVYTEAPFLSIGRILVLQKLFEMLGPVYPQYSIITRIQNRNEDRLLYVYMKCPTGRYSFNELIEGVNIVSSLFDAFELGGGITEKSAYYFIEQFCTLAPFSDFLKKMVEYHGRLVYDGDMGGGMEESDICIYQSLLALMVMFPERFHVLQESKTFCQMKETISKNLKNPEWKSDMYELKEGWLEQALCMCLVIQYPKETRNALLNSETEWGFSRELCDLYLRIAGW